MTQLANADAKTQDAARPRDHRVGDAFEKYGLVILLIAVIGLFTLLPATSNTFPTSGNFQAIVGNQAVLGVAAIAATIPLVCGQIDLSGGATVGLSSLVAADVMSTQGASAAVGFLTAVAVGLAVGGFNALLVGGVRVNALITTLGTTTVIAGIVTWYTEGVGIVSGIPTSMTSFGSGTTLGVPRILLGLVIMTLIASYLLALTPLGRHLTSVGSNPLSAKLVGLQVNKLVASSFIISGLISGIAGFMLIARTSGANPQSGPDLTLPALAAVFLGATVIRPGHFNIGGTLVAIFFLATLSSGMALAGAEPYVTSLINGSALILGVAFSAVIARQRGTEAPAGAGHFG